MPPTSQLAYAATESPRAARELVRAATSSQRQGWAASAERAPRPSTSPSDRRGTQVNRQRLDFVETTVHCVKRLYWISSTVARRRYGEFALFGNLLAAYAHGDYRRA
jgi:hypothetical protein